MKKFLLAFLCLLTIGIFPGYADENLETFTVNFKDKETASLVEGEQGIPAGLTNSNLTYSQTFNTKFQSTKDNSATLTISGMTGCTITAIQFHTRSNAKAGAGSMTVKVGQSEILSFSGDYNSAWSSAYTSSYEWISKVVDTEREIADNENVVMTLACTTNSLYWDGVKITYKAPAGAVVFPTVTFNPAGGNVDVNSTMTATLSSLENVDSWSLEVESGEATVSDNTVTFDTLGEVVIKANVTIGEDTRAVGSATYNVIDPTDPVITVTKSSFSGSDNEGGSLDDVISYVTNQNSSTTPPAINNENIRLYQDNNDPHDGGSIKISAKVGYEIISVAITTATKTSAAYKIDEGEYGEAESLSANGTLNITDIEASSVEIINRGADKNARLDISKIVVKYVAEGAVPQTPVITAPAELDLGAGINAAPAAKTITVTGKNLTAAVTYRWKTGGIFNAEGTLTAEGGELTISLDKTEAGEYNDVLVLTSGEVEKEVAVSAKIVTLTGTGEGTEENPYDVTRALSILANGVESTADVYVKGTIVGTPEVSVQFKNATYTISDNTEDEALLTIYRGKYLNNEDFTSEDQIRVGDIVTVLGKLVNYTKDDVTTPEMGQGNYIVNLVRETPPGPATLNLSFDKEEVEVAINTEDVKAEFPTLTTSAGFEGTLVWSSSDEDVATISADGETVELKSVGDTRIAVKFAGNDDWTQASASFTLKVVAAPEPGEEPMAVIDFNNEGWNFPTAYVKVETSYTDGDYTITCKPGTAGDGWKKQSKYLLIGKNGASIVLPAFDFVVEKIEVKAADNSSGKVTYNIFAGEDALAAEDVKATTEDHTFVVPAELQEVGTQYVITITNENNGQFGVINFYGHAAPEVVEMPDFSVDNDGNMKFYAPEGCKIWYRIVKAQESEAAPRRDEAEYQLYVNGTSLTMEPGQEAQVYAENALGQKSEVRTITYQDYHNVMTGIDAVEAEMNLGVRYFNLQGVEVKNPTQGTYIRLEGTKATKVLVK